MNFLKFDRDALPEPESGAPAPDKVIDGDPRFTSWTLDQTAPNTFAGYWAATPGSWRVAYDEWEYCTLVEGHAVVTEDGHAPVELRAGDHFIFRPGYQGVWRVVEPVLKTFVVILR
ncbi:MAG: cupin domain-containing protein [Asticcacaulis sp.]|jgi:uncharacterized cupin superfamily protein|uniref:cupin domain-containing protein n=1 Tax=Asticcacaulis sp. TaxID=1872648 RepID=UPI003F7C5A3E